MQFIFLLISIYTGRKNPLFFLIFPLALLQGPGAFLDTRTVLIAPEVFLLVKNIFKDVIILYLFAVVFYLNRKVNFNYIWKTPMKWFILYILLLSLITISSYSTGYEAIAVIRLFLYMPLGYYLLLLIFTTASTCNFEKFFNFIFIVNIVQSILYIFNSSKVLPIFDQSFTYLEVESGMGEFNRDFLTIPLFSNFLFILALANILTKSYKINKFILYSTLTTYPLVLLYTFTRSLLTITVLELIMVLFIVSFYSPSKIFKPQLLAIIVGATLLFSVSKIIFLDEIKYFNERIEGATKEGKNDQNIDIRITYHEKAWKYLSDENSLLKGYALNKRLEPQMNNLGAWSADSTIPFLLIYTGIIGVIIYFWNQLYFLFKCMQLKFHLLNPLAITLFVSIFTSILSSFIMGGIPWGSPIIFINFVFVTYLAYIQPSHTKKNLNFN